MRSAGRLARAIVRLYPRAWRERYGDELVALIEDRPASVRAIADAIRVAGGEWVSIAVRRWLRPGQGEVMVRQIARVTVQVIVAWAVAVAIYALFPVVLTSVAAMFGWVGPEVAERQFGFLIRGRGSYAPLSVTFLLVICTVFASLVILVLRVMHRGRLPVRVAQAAAGVAFVAAGLLWRNWWIGLSVLHALQVTLTLGAAAAIVTRVAFSGRPPAQQPTLGARVPRIA